MQKKRKYAHRFLLYYIKAMHVGIQRLLKIYKREQINKEWRKRNPHNITRVGNELSEMVFPLDKVKVGNYTYGALKVFSYNNSDDEMLCIGSFCSIAINTKFILGGMHPLDHISTYPFKTIFQSVDDSFSKGKIIVEDDVWIGSDSVILSGVTIARGTVVAAGSVVTKSTLPYSIVGGNPAKLIKYRFTQEIIDRLMKFDFSKLTPDFIHENMEELYKPVDGKLLDNLLF